MSVGALVKYATVLPPSLSYLMVQGGLTMINHSSLFILGII